MSTERDGWYEFITPDEKATTHIAYVYEDGSVYLPEGPDVATEQDFRLASATARFWRLVREPRTVTTAAELDALPVGSVVRSSAGTIACKCEATRGIVFGDDRTFPWLKLATPATVLHAPMEGQ